MHDLTYIKYQIVVKFIDIERMVVSREWEEEEVKSRELLFNGSGAAVWEEGEFCGGWW